MSKYEIGDEFVVLNGLLSDHTNSVDFHKGDKVVLVINNFGYYYFTGKQKYLNLLKKKITSSDFSLPSDSYSLFVESVIHRRKRIKRI